MQFINVIFLVLAMSFSTMLFAGEREDKLIDAVKRGDLNKVKEQLNKGADVQGKDNDGDSPLHWAASKGQLEISKILISKGALVHSKDYKGWTPLHLAQNIDLAKLLIDNGADINAKTKNGDTPLHWSAYFGLKEVSQLLIDSGADPGAKNNLERTPLHLADNVAIADLLIGKGVNVNERDKQGSTALHTAVIRSKTDLVKLLLEKGADQSLKNNQGQSPYDIAKDDDMKRLLKP